MVEVLKTRFKLTEIGRLNSILGIKVSQNVTGILISQTQYIGGPCKQIWD